MSDTTPPIPPPPSSPPQAPEPPPTPAPTPNGASFTQEQVEAMIKERIANTRKSHSETMAAILGDRKPEEVTAILQAHDEQLEAQKTEHEKAIEAANKARAEAEAVKAEADRARLEALLSMELTAPGVAEDGEPLSPVQREYLDTVLALALPIALGSDAEDPVSAAVAAVRKSAAPMFAPVETPPPTPGPGTNRPAPTPNRTHGETTRPPKDRAASAVERYKRAKGIQD